MTIDEKDLKKKLIKTMRWISREFDYVEKFKDEIKELEGNSEADKHLRKASFFLRYIGKVEQRASGLESDIGKELPEVYDLLIRHFSHDSSIIAILTNLRNSIRNFNIGRAELAKYALWHIGELDENFLNLRLMQDKMIKPNKEYYALAKQLEQDIEKVEKWIQAIEINIKEVNMLLDKLPIEEYNLLERYFDGRNLNFEQLEKIYAYRMKCIAGISRVSVGFRESPTNFEESSSMLMKNMLKNSSLIRAGMVVEEKHLKQYLHNRVIIDLGSGPNPMTNIEFFSEYGAKKFIGVDIDSPPHSSVNGMAGFIIEGHQSDFLSYLMSVPDNSACIISSGVFLVGEVLTIQGNESYNYYRFLAKEMNRILPKDGFSFHMHVSRDFINIFNKFMELMGARYDCYLWVKR